MDLSSTETVIQGGAVGLALALSWIVYKLLTNHDNHLLDALNRNTDAWVRNAEALTRLTDHLNK